MLFKKKKHELERSLLPKFEETLPKHEEIKPVVKKEVKPVEKPMEPPLFIKLDRYREVISNLTQLKTLVVVVKNSLSTLSQLEKARTDTIEVIKKTLDKINEKLSALDNELVKPTGFTAAPTPEYHEIQSVETSIASLRGQIEQLKAELQALSS